MIRAIIIDDEPLAIEALSLLLERKCRDDVQVIATSTNPQSGRELIEKHQPDLLFVDVEMPGMSGLDLIRQFPEASFKVVFVTAFDDYAIEALRLSAIDYLLKPLEAEEIMRVINKIKNESGKNENWLGVRLQQLEKIITRRAAAESPKIGIGMAEKIVFVKIADIIYCKAEGAYTHAFMIDGTKIVASRSLGEFEQQLSSHNFFRIHHSTLINLGQIKEFQRFNGGVIMANNEKLEVSHRKKNEFLKAIEGHIL